MGKTSTKAKNKYNAANYDRIALSVPKGERERIREHATLMGESVNAFVCRAISETMERDMAKDGE